MIGGMLFYSNINLVIKLFESETSLKIIKENKQTIGVVKIKYCTIFFAQFL